MITKSKRSRAETNERLRRRPSAARHEEKKHIYRQAQQRHPSTDRMEPRLRPPVAQATVLESIANKGKMVSTLTPKGSRLPKQVYQMRVRYLRQMSAVGRERTASTPDMAEILLNGRYSRYPPDPADMPDLQQICTRYNEYTAEAAFLATAVVDI